jgi:hypothetical protein
MWYVALYVVLVLWLNGRYWRDRWSLMPDYQIHHTTTGSGQTIVVLCTGAFNDAVAHYERLIPLYQQVGDVYVVRYAKKRFDAHEAMRGAYEFAAFYNYDRVVLVGASLGGEVALRFVEHTRSNTHFYDPAIEFIACDVPLGAQHLPAPAFLLRVVQYVRVGPLFNLLSPIITRLWFKRLEVDPVTGVDAAHLDRHMAGLWSCKLSVIVEQIAAMAIQPPFTDVAGIPTVYLKCAVDDVIRGNQALADWRELMSHCLYDVIDVEGGHVQFVEHHNEWYRRHAQALRELGHNIM